MRRGDGAAARMALTPDDARGCCFSPVAAALGAAVMKALDGERAATAAKAASTKERMMELPAAVVVFCLAGELL